MSTSLLQINIQYMKLASKHQIGSRRPKESEDPPQQAPYTSRATQLINLKPPNASGNIPHLSIDSQRIKYMSESASKRQQIALRPFQRDDRPLYSSRLRQPRPQVKFVHYECPQLRNKNVPYTANINLLLKYLEQGDSAGSEHTEDVLSRWVHIKKSREIKEQNKLERNKDQQEQQQQNAYEFVTILELTRLCKQYQKELANAQYNIKFLQQKLMKSSKEIEEVYISQLDTQKREKQKIRSDLTNRLQKAETKNEQLFDQVQRLKMEVNRLTSNQQLLQSIKSCNIFQQKKLHELQNETFWHKRQKQEMSLVVQNKERELKSVWEKNYMLQAQKNCKQNEFSSLKNERIVQRKTMEDLRIEIQRKDSQIKQVLQILEKVQIMTGVASQKLQHKLNHREI